MKPHSQACKTLNWVQMMVFVIYILLKATVSFCQDWLGLPCLVQLLTWLYVLDYHNLKDYSLSVNTLPLNNVTETSSKMASTLFSKMVKHFLPKSSKLCRFCTIRFCTNFTSMWSYTKCNTYKIMNGENLNFQCQCQ